MKFIGIIIIIAGIVLAIGNKTGSFHTFPFAGFITMIIGGVIMKAGGK